MFNTFRIFPTCFVKSNIDRNFTEQEIDYLKSIDYFLPNIGNMVSAEKFILNDPSMQDVKNFCIEGINHYMNDVLKPKNAIEVYITQSWINHTKPGEFHHSHKHSNSFLSGVFYIKSSEDNGKMRFNSPVPDTILEFEKETNTLENSRSWIVPVKTGDLIIFPSTLIHSVDKTEGTDVRISLSFNTFVKGHFGESESANELILTS